ncbi:ribosomal protein S5 domain 2-type protein [Gilbertella persicaria]|uniref:ribosomal protein S5 domain 2-type protein n=1 Tax=Gilbertella persicaria TaxID=101096 RepID=UPI00221E6AFE|nr:ribosomal protein S5 domain 2-type protein [Gilbertella persicaria]KAI8073514.1 ribosomal protein S5 domain 2-type protein [Gilbertella persicaria]
MALASKTLIILASATTQHQLEKDIKERYDSTFLRFRGVPKGLLPISGKPVLTWWYDDVKHHFKDIYIVSNAYNFKHFERWASGVSFSRQNVLNSGLSTGVLSDIAFVHRVKNIQSDVVITSPEAFCDTKDILSLLSRTRNFVYYNQQNIPFAFGMSYQVLEGLDDVNEKKLATSAKDLEHGWPDELDSYMQQQPDTRLETVENSPLLNYVHPNLSLQDYLNQWESCLDHRLKLDTPCQTEPIHMKAYARVGLMGNPSDGFYGKTLSLLISNFWAEVTLIPNSPDDKQLEAIRILPNPVSDPHKFASMASLVGISDIDGYDTGDRLLQACCKVFYTYCQSHQIPIDTHQGFRMMFETNIPRQVGLAGSSAIITALWKALAKFYGVTREQIPLELQASLVLKVEQEELSIAAGLQDRVIQSYGGLVYMDFDRAYMDQHGHGKYESLDVQLLPKLWLAYVADPEDSGKVHSTVKQRFLNGDQEIVTAMKKFGSLTDQARESLENHDHKRFAELMSANFDLRRETYGDSVVGASNLRMIELARQHNCAAKFPGSGGAIVGMWNPNHNTDTQAKDLLHLRRVLESEGYVFLEIFPQTL